ncbi:hypothetical protein KC906_03295 [Candidatus Kaiserbacteria bacterium]|nr:hypothetical protein [Candidatus Kaiserbacteria bacterium]
MTQTLTHRIIIAAIGSFILCGGIIQTASAETVVRSGEVVSIAKEQVIEGDFYSMASKVNISGSVEEDAVVAAGQVTVNGSVGNNAFLVGGRIDVHGTVGDDLRIVAGETTIAEPIMGDVMVVGGVVQILSTASIAGDIILLAGNVVIEGSVGGDVVGTVGQLTIDAPVAGDVDVTVEQISLGSQADVQGSVRYVSESLIIQDPSSNVAGETMRNDPVILGSQPTLYAAVIPVLVLLFSVLVWYLLSRKSLDVVIGRALVKSPRPFLLGSISIILMPLITMLLFVSMIGSLLGFAVLAGFLFMVMLSIIGISAVMGRLLMTLFNQPHQHSSLLSLLVGVTAMGLLMLLPPIGQLTAFFLILLTLGAMIDILLRPTLPPKR